MVTTSDVLPDGKGIAIRANLRIVAPLAAVALLVALGVVVSIGAFRQIHEASDARTHTESVIHNANALLSSLKDAETGQRGYLLTDDETFLEPYLAVRDHVSGQLKDLRQLTLDRAAQEHLDAMAPLLDGKLAELARTIELRRNHDLPAALAAVGSGQGKRLMDAIRVEMGSFIQIEEGALAQHDTAFRADMSQLFTFIALACVMALLFALAFAYVVYRETQHRLENVELESARLVAERGSLAKSDFLSSMSHELRSPLNAILGFAQLMESDTPPPSPAQQDSIAQILQAGWHLLNLINEVLDLSKIESGQLSLSPEPLSVADVMAECRAMVHSQAQQRGISLTFPPSSLPFFVHADRTRVKQVLINLLSNAIKYNKPQGTVVVDCYPSAPKRIRITVTDTGEGLPPEKVAQLFQPFNRLGQEAGGQEGTGIGLVVTKQLVALMGGSISAESTVGVGSVFSIELIADVAPDLPVQTDAPAVVVQPHVPDHARLRIVLYVEDNPANLALVEHLIARRPDLRLLTAVEGRPGIELARTAQPEMILMDINLPDISGIEALKILRADPATAHIPVVALSANAMPRDIEKGLAAGFYRYLTKPIMVKDFMDTLDATLKFAKHGEPSAQGK